MYSLCNLVLSLRIDSSVALLKKTSNCVMVLGTSQRALSLYLRSDFLN